MAWDLSCRDWEARIREGRPLVPDLPLDRAAADRAVRVFNRLRLADVPGNPLLADAAGEWFRDIVRALFGSWDPVAKERHIQEIFAVVPKKSAKTTYSALMMLTAVLLNERPNAKFLLVAPTQDVTELAFSQVAGAIALDSVLEKMFRVQHHIKRVTHLTTGASLEIMSFDPQVLTGQKPAGFLIDELHVMSSSVKATTALGQLRGGMIAQPEAFGVIITTQSERQPAGVFKVELANARKVRDGQSRGKTLPVIYEFPPDVAADREKWSNPSNWHMVNPNLGRGVTLDRLLNGVGSWTEAEERGIEEVTRWASQHLNIEVGIGITFDRWRGADHWIAAADETLTLDALLDRSEVVVCGIDGGGLDDMLGLAVLGREAGGRIWLHWGKAWMHEGVLLLRKAEAARFRDFQRDGDLVIVSDMEQAFTEIADTVALVAEHGVLARVGLDPMGVGMIVDALAERGIDGDRVVAVSQGWTLNGAIKTAEVKLASGALLHSGQKLLAWCAGNCKAEAKGNAITITKQAAGAGKIDPVMALFNAVALMSRNPEAQGKSFWDDEDNVAAVYGAPQRVGAWDPGVLSDIRHPMFADHKAAFEAWQDMQPDD